MRILYFHRVAWPDSRAHAIQIARATTAFAGQGAEVVLHVRRRRRGRPGGAPPVDLGGVENLRLVRLRWPHDARWRLAWRLAAWRLRAGAGGRTAVYLRETGRYAWTIARAAYRLGLPLFYEAHNIKCLLVEEAKGAEAASEWEGMEREIFEAARGVIFTSPLTERFARDRFAFTEHVLVAPNAAPVEALQVGRSSDLPPPDDATGRRDIDILYPGQLYAWKGVDLMLAALARLPGRSLTILGGLGGQEEIARARAVAEHAGVADRVTFAGQVGPREVFSYMARSRCGVIPLPGGGSIEARYFTAPLKLFEFWATGLPVVASDLPSLRALVRDGETGLLAAPEPADLAAALGRLLADGALARRLSEAGLREAEGRTWDSRAAAILEFIERTLAAPRGRAVRAPSEERPAG